MIVCKPWRVVADGWVSRFTVNRLKPISMIGSRRLVAKSQGETSMNRVAKHYAMDEKELLINVTVYYICQTLAWLDVPGRFKCIGSSNPIEIKQTNEQTNIVAWDGDHRLLWDLAGWGPVHGHPPERVSPDPSTCPRSISNRAYNNQINISTKTPGIQQQTLFDQCSGFGTGCSSASAARRKSDEQVSARYGFKLHSCRDAPYL